jgi:hypothetical protein
MQEEMPPVGAVGHRGSTLPYHERHVQAALGGTKSSIPKGLCRQLPILSACTHILLVDGHRF